RRRIGNPEKRGDVVAVAKVLADDGARTDCYAWFLLLCRCRRPAQQRSKHKQGRPRGRAASAANRVHRFHAFPLPDFIRPPLPETGPCTSGWLSILPEP